MKGKLVYSTRWEENGPTESPYGRVTVEIVFIEQDYNERLEALSKRPTLNAFVRREVRSHVAV